MKRIPGAQALAWNGRIATLLVLAQTVGCTAPSSDDPAAADAPTPIAVSGPAPDRGAAGGEDPSRPRWNKFHTAAEANASLEAWGHEYPVLTSVYSIGETLAGSPLMVIEITNKATGAAEDKPAYYYDGGIHAGELTGGEVALHFAWYVLSNYGVDEQITRLVDTRALYVRPKFNPDGADIALTSAQTLRSTPRPYDNDGDGLLDEDPPNDLDGDAHITRMRVPNPDGAWYISPDDARLMLRRPRTGADGFGGGPPQASPAPPAGTQFYDVLSEGVDDDRDGRTNEDGIGGIDMNRNFPRNWGLEFEQSGAGPYPLSEPETAATIAFLNSHRNITGIFHGHTSGGFAFRLPSTTAWSEFPSADQELILEQSAKYEETTGQQALPSYTNPEVHRHGTLISWGFWDFGVVGFVPEFWRGIGTDDDKDGEISELERLRYHDEELESSYITDWAPYEHPELGTVEIGGWHSKFVSQNPPRELLQGEVELYVPWMLWLAEIAPQIEISDVTVETVQPRQGDDDSLRHVRVEVTNTGYLPTHLTQRALDAEVAVPVRAIATLTGAEFLEGNGRVDVGHLAGTRDNGDAPGPDLTTGVADFLVRLTAPTAEMALTVASERGGVVRQTLALQR